MAGVPTILFVEVSGQRPLPRAPAIQVAGQGAKILFASGTEQACQILTSAAAGSVRILISNIADVTLFETARKFHAGCENILVTLNTIHSYTEALQQRDAVLLDHVIAQLSEEWTVDDLRVTVQKILRSDYFGIEKYLNINTTVMSRLVKSSQDRESCNLEVQKWVESCGLSRNVSRLTFGITEELLMNAIYDAPVAGGRTHYDQLERTTQRELNPDEYSWLRYGCDGKVLALAIEDPFGAFQREKFWQYTRKILKRDDAEGLIDTKKGGAGLGIFKMLYSSHGVVCNVDPGKKTEVIVLIDLNQPVRDFASMPRSIHYFNAQQS